MPEPLVLTSPIRDRAAWHLAAAAAMHAVNDALFAGVYPLLPLIAADLHLTYGEVGAVKAILGGASAILQVPAGALAAVVDEHLLLAAGTAWVGAGLAAMALATAVVPLLGLALVAGIGGNSQHPVANAAVAHRFDDRERPAAIGTLNFAGDVGKIIAPLIGAFGTSIAGWRGGVAALGGLGVAFALAYAVVVPVRWRRPQSHSNDATRASVTSDDTVRSHGRFSAHAWGVAKSGPYAALTLIGALDAAARGAALALLPFAFTAAGMDATDVTVAFAVMFGAGAAGKFLCGPLASRFGGAATIIATELVTAIGIVTLAVAPASALLWAILPFGFALNGTSSVLYALVAPLAVPSRRAQAYGLYYTAILLATAVAPVLYGAVADFTGLTVALEVLAAVTVFVAPLTWRWRRAFVA